MWDVAGATSWLGERLFSGSLQGAVVIGLVWVVCRWVPRVPASLQAWVWWLVALKLALTLVPLPALRLPLLPAGDLGSGPELTLPALDEAGTNAASSEVLLCQPGRPARLPRRGWTR